MNVLERFQYKFNEIQENNQILISFKKERKNEAIQKDTKIIRIRDKFYLSEIETNINTNTKKILLKNKRITENSLQNEHACLINLFNKLTPKVKPEWNMWESFKAANHKVKWLLKTFLLDTILVGGLVGRIIAYAANKENPHYKTIPSNILADTLAPLIFPAGKKRPVLEKKGLISIDPILHKQLKAKKDYNPVVKTHHDEEIKFESTKVPLQLRGVDLSLDTVVASNSLVQEDKNHLHIVYFNGNSGCYQQDYKSVAEDLSCYSQEGVPATAILFNYPGDSEGEVEIAQDLIDAGIAQIQTLLNQGIPHSKIVLHGVSLGGSIASHVKKNFDNLDMPNNPSKKQTLGGLYVTCTFASTTRVAEDFFNRALGDNIFSRTLAAVCLPFIKLGVWASEWDLDTGKAFFSIAREKRQYAVILSSKADRRAYHKKHQGTFKDRLVSFIFRKTKNPVDDAILRRGLHNSWERKLERLWIKLGFYGKKAREEYSKMNRFLKVVVVDLKTQQPLPEVDGHAKAGYRYLSSKNNEWYHPKKETVYGLLHRSEDKGVLYEAGAVARQSMRIMAGC